MPEVLTVETPSLGDRSYIVSDGAIAVVIDAQRDIDRILEMVTARGLRITHVLETHIHNDYITGGYALSQQVGATYVVAADDDVSFERLPVREGDVVESGALRFRVVHTPGHTFTHVSYVLETDGDVVAVFSGGSLLFGSTGRPDLLGEEHTHRLVRLQHESANRLTAMLPESAELYPTHGFGSFCSASQSEATASTIGDEKAANPAVTSDVDTFIRQTLAGLDAYPAYYARMAPANSAGPAAADLSPVRQVDVREVARRIDTGEWVVDLRNRTAFARAHVPRTLNFGIDGSFVTYLGWLLPPGTPVTLLAETAEEVAQAQRDMARIGIDRPVASATGPIERLLDRRPAAAYRTAAFAQLRATLDQSGSDIAVLDVRRHDERRDGAIDGSVHMPLHDLLGRIEELPRDRTVWVHCAAGYRASIAASVLDAAGLSVVAVDDDFSAAAEAGLRVIPAGAERVEPLGPVAVEQR